MHKCSLAVFLLPQKTEWNLFGDASQPNLWHNEPIQMPFEVCLSRIQGHDCKETSASQQRWESMVNPKRDIPKMTTMDRSVDDVCGGRKCVPCCFNDVQDEEVFRVVELVSN